MIATDNIGFTGTRGGLTPWQILVAGRFLMFHRCLGFTRFHFGDCVGADAYVAGLARSLGFWLVSHPPIVSRLRAFVRADEERAPLPYLQRNAAIVAQSDIGLVLPGTEIPPATGSGSWWTRDQFHRARVPHWVVTPSGLSIWIGEEQE